MIAPLTKQRDELLKVEPTEFRDDIEREYLDAVRTTIALEVALTSSGFNLDLLTLKILLEEIDLKQYLEPKENS